MAHSNLMNEFFKFLCLAGSPVWGELVLALLILVALGTSVHLYRSQEARERVCRWAQEMRARSVNDCFESCLCFVSEPGGQGASLSLGTVDASQVSQ